MNEQAATLTSGLSLLCLDSIVQAHKRYFEFVRTT